MRLQKLVGLVAILVILMGLLPAWAAAAPAWQEEEEIGPNLLVDGNFEAPPTWPMQDGIGEVQVAPGWRAWYLDTPPSYAIPPSSCYRANGSVKDNGCFWMRPEFRDTVRDAYSNRVHSGERAQKYFSFGRMHEGGLLQQVHNVPVGAKLRFSIYIQAWMCSDAGKSNICSDGAVSDAPSDMHLRIGIDPTGGVNAFSPNIVWSREVPAWDRWVRFQVEAIAQSSTVTVFTHSRPEWDWARMNNDVYLDDAELVTVGPIPTPEPTAAPADELQPQPQPQPQSQPQSQPQAQPVIRSDGTQVHRVVYGDTLLGIALAYGVTVDELVQWNNLNPGDFLQIEQELIVKAPPGWTPPQLPANPTPAAAVALAPTAAPAPVGQAAPVAGSPAGLCVVAFEDQNMNTLYDNNERLVVGAQFEVMDSATVIKSHTTDGSEPYCFSELGAGTYVVVARPAEGYKATSVEKMGVSVAAGQTVNVACGSISTDGPSSGKVGNRAGLSLAGAASSQNNPLSNVGGVLVSVSGLVVLLIAGVVGTVMSRRG